MPMTPQEITDYKAKWRPGVVVYLHSDIKSQATGLVKSLFKREQWHFMQWVAPYRHALHFETAEIAEKFKREVAKKQLGKWVYDLPE